MVKQLKSVFAFIGVLTVYACSTASVTDTKNSELAYPIVIQKHDLVQQSKTGDGEGLAKPVPNQPLLVNNQLIYSSIGDVALGVAMAVGAIDKAIGKFVDMPALQVEDALNAIIAERSATPQWQTLLTHLKKHNKKLVLAPYGYVNGYPNAIVELRLFVSVQQGDKSILQRQLSKKSDAKPVAGDDSWSVNEGENIQQMFTQAMPGLVDQVNALLLTELGLLKEM